jgi:hypothetical protein
MRKLVTPNDYITPRTVSLKELRARLLPLIGGWTWADDAINDLWLLGAPDPQAHMCPQVAEGSGKPCPARECPHVKRILLPKQFQKWWAEVAARQGYELSAAQALALPLADQKRARGQALQVVKTNRKRRH